MQYCRSLCSQTRDALILGIEIGLFCDAGVTVV